MLYTSFPLCKQMFTTVYKISEPKTDPRSFWDNIMDWVRIRCISRTSVRSTSSWIQKFYPRSNSRTSIRRSRTVFVLVRHAQSTRTCNGVYWRFDNFTIIVTCFKITNRLTPLFLDNHRLTTTKTTKPFCSFY